jgi:hypothetical protein
LGKGLKNNKRRSEMDRKSVRIGIILLVVSMIFLSYQQAMAFYTGKAKDVRVVRIYGNWEGGQGGVQIEPKITWIGTYTILVWANQSDTEVQIKFLKGKACTEATAPTPKFKLNEMECWVTSAPIASGDSTSAFFHAPGQYEYEIEYLGKNHKETGIINVMKD